jgi:hypothetical protein
MGITRRGRGSDLKAVRGSAALMRTEGNCDAGLNGHDTASVTIRCYSNAIA